MIAYWRDYLIQYILYIFFMYTGNKKWNFLASPRNQSGKDIVITKCYIYVFNVLPQGKECNIVSVFGNFHSMQRCHS